MVTGLLAGGITTSPLTSTYPRVGSEPMSTNTARSLRKVAHGDHCPVAILNSTLCSMLGVVLRFLASVKAIPTEPFPLLAAGLLRTARSGQGRAVVARRSETLDGEDRSGTMRREGNGRRDTRRAYIAESPSRQFGKESKKPGRREYDKTRERFQRLTPSVSLLSGGSILQSKGGPFLASGEGELTSISDKDTKGCRFVSFCTLAGFMKMSVKSLFRMAGTNSRPLP